MTWGNSHYIVLNSNKINIYGVFESAILLTAVYIYIQRETNFILPTNLQDLQEFHIYMKVWEALTIPIHFTEEKN